MSHLNGFTPVKEGRSFMLKRNFDFCLTKANSSDVCSMFEYKRPKRNVHANEVSNFIIYIFKNLAGTA